MKIHLIALFGILIPFLSTAQSKSFRTHANIGISTPILDNGIGFQVGLNPSLRLNKFISAEGQISYNFTKTTGSFLAGKTGKSNSANLLGGLGCI